MANAAGVEGPEPAGAREHRDRRLWRERRIRVARLDPPELKHLPAAQRLARRVERGASLAETPAVEIELIAGRRTPRVAASGADLVVAERGVSDAREKRANDVCRWLMS